MTRMSARRKWRHERLGGGAIASQIRDRETGKLTFRNDWSATPVRAWAQS